jgi:hypothetical protein
MATAKQRGVLVDQITKLGMPESIRQGYFDPVIDGLVTDNPDTPAELIFRIEKVEQDVNSNNTMITTTGKNLEKTDVRVADLESVAARQEAALALQKAEVQRLTDEIKNSEQNNSKYDQEIIDRKQSDSQIQGQFTTVNLAISGLQSKDVDQDRRIGNLEGLVTGNEPGGLKEVNTKLGTKADLVGGKIPMSQLPELPTGRKVTVANEGDRLVLPVHTDITIAYQTSDGLAYILGANADPSVPANWQRIGNTAATGVTSFNGRAGVVQPESGDYTTSMIVESPTQQFVSEAQKNNWNAKASKADITSEGAAIRQEASETYLRKDSTDYIKSTDKGVANGIAPLGNDGKVSTSYLPPLGMTVAQQTKLNDASSTAILANQKGDIAAQNILAVDNKFETHQAQADSRLAALESNRTQDRNLINANTDKNAAQDTRLAALEAKADQAGIPVSEKAAANGVAPLDADGKVPLENLPIAPVTTRNYSDVKTSRTIGTFVATTTDNEKTVMITANSSSSATRQLIAQVRKVGTTTPVFTIKSDVLGAGFDHTSNITFSVPKGWEYTLTNGGGTTIAGVDTWYELN